MKKIFILFIVFIAGSLQLQGLKDVVRSNTVSAIENSPQSIEDDRLKIEQRIVFRFQSVFFVLLQMMYCEIIKIAYFWPEKLKDD